MSHAFLTRMPAGVAGDVSRKGLSKIEPRAMNRSAPVLRYGEGLKLVGDKIQPIASGDTIAADFYGLGVRPYPMQPNSLNQGLAEGSPNVDHPLDVLVSGYMTVKCNAGTPALGGTVYCRVSASGLDSQPIGGIEADADGSDCEAVPGAIFMGVADADGMVEIRYNI